jgi:hypothetical protein
MPRKLTKLRINEISAVDKGASEGTRTLLWKRADDDAPQGDDTMTRYERRSRLKAIFDKAFRKARSEYDEEESGEFSRDPAGVDDPQDDDGARERRNEDQYEDREEADQEHDIVHPKPRQLVAALRLANPA